MTGIICMPVMPLRKKKFKKLIPLPVGFPDKIFAKIIGIMDIFQINSFQISKYMFYYHNQLLPSMFFYLFETSRPVHNYST